MSLGHPRDLAARLPAALRSRRFLVWAAILGALAGVLAFVPLFDVLGFEFSFVVGLAASLAAADVATRVVADEQAAPSPGPGGPRTPARAVAVLWARAAQAAAALLVLPLVLISLNALRVRQCDWVQGLTFLVLLPGISAPLGAAAGVVAGVVSGRRRRLARLAAVGFVLASLAVGVWRFYAAPPIFGYDPFAGWFPGSLYDENLSISPAFLWSRVYQVALATTALAALAALIDPATATVARPRGLRPGPLVLATIAGVVAVLVGMRGPTLGFRVDAGSIAERLGGRIETEHFVVLYPAGAPFAADMPAIARDHELRLAQVVRTLGIEPPQGKITSYYFGSAAEKQRWMGAGTTYIAKPWRHEIYLQHDDFPHRSLRHEIAHVVAGEFGDPLFKVSVRWFGWPPARFNVGMIEGIAVAADWPAHYGGRLTPHQSARALLELDKLPPLARLLTPGFFSFSSAQSYATAGSFVHFVLERHGAAAVRTAYRGGGTDQAFRQATGQSLVELESSWRAFLGTVTVDSEDVEIARERFRRPGIFSRPCAHAIAARTARADTLIDRGRADEAVDLLRRVCADDPHEPGHRLDLAGALEGAGRDAEAEAVYRELADEPSQPAPLRARALARLADTLARRGDLPDAAAAVAQSLALPIDENTRRTLVVRALSLDQAGAGGEALRSYLLARSPGGREPDPLVLMARALEVSRLVPDSGLGLYLQGRLLAGHGGYPEAARALLQAHELGLPHPLVARENDRLLAIAAFLSGDLATARVAATRLASGTNPQAIRLEGEDWLERLKFAETGSL